MFRNPDKILLLFALLKMKPHCFKQISDIDDDDNPYKLILSQKPKEFNRKLIVQVSEFLELHFSNCALQTRESVLIHLYYRVKNYYGVKNVDYFYLSTARYKAQIDLAKKCILFRC